MPYSRAYESYFTNQEGQDVHIIIYDTTSFTTVAVETYISEMNPSGDPLHIAIVDNDEDKFTPVRAKEATIKILTDNNVNLSLFAADSIDNRWFVVIYINTTDRVVFKGFLVLNDVQCPFLDNFVNSEFTLTATDGLGLLKDIPFVKPDGTNPKGENKIIEYVSWALQLTGLKLQINVMWNLMEESLQGLPAFNNVYINAKTFEGDINQNKNVADTQNIYNKIGTSINAYDVLTRILGEEAYITQWKGAWWIRRIDEYEANPLYYDQYTYDGIYMNTIPNQFFNKQVVKDGTIQLVQPATNVVPDRAYSYVVERASLEMSAEPIDNIAFLRGGLLSPVIPSLNLYITTYDNLSSFPIPGDPAITYYAHNTGFFYQVGSAGNNYVRVFGSDIPSAVAYTIDDWVTTRIPNLTPQATAYITRIFQGGVERERYAVLPLTPNGGHAIYCNPVPIGYKDKISISVDRRFSSNKFGSGTATDNVIWVRLYGADGSYWNLTNIVSGNENPGDWIKTDANFSTNQRFISYQWNRGQEDETEWHGVSVDSRPVPVSGTIVVYLMQSGLFYNTTQTHFNNLQFSYKPFIGGSYEKFTAQYNKVYQLGTYKANRDKQIYIDDLPRPYFKGALKRKINNVFSLCGKWYNGAVPTIRSQNPVDPQFLHPMGYIRAYTVWNQYRRVMKHLDANLIGLESGSELPDLMHTYYFQDNSPLTINKLYMLIHYDHDLYRCEWKGYFAEVFDIVLAKKYSDGYEFKYVENR